jgi:hypothetical protein
MYRKILLVGSLAVVSVFAISCSNGSLLHAPNGKTYYIDTDNCARYSLKRDTLYCYKEKDSVNPDKVYKPVTFGYKIDSRESY